MSPFVSMFRLTSLQEKTWLSRYTMDTRNEYRDTAFNENRRVNVSIGVHEYSVSIIHVSSRETGLKCPRCFIGKLLQNVVCTYTMQYINRFVSCFILFPYLVKNLVQKYRKVFHTSTIVSVFFPLFYLASKKNCGLECERSFFLGTSKRCLTCFYMQNFRTD